MGLGVPELNLRLYVTHEGKPGVWFLSLDAGNSLAVWAARRFFHLPYYWARMSVRGLPTSVQYKSTRRSSPTVTFRAEYASASEPYEAQSGTLEHWLTERYCLYAQSPRGDLYRGEIHHHPWPLRSATAEIPHNELLEPHGLAVKGPPVLLHAVRQIDVVVWSLDRLER